MKKEFMVVLYNEKEKKTKIMYFFTREEMDTYLKTRRSGTGYVMLYKFKFEEVE